MHGQLAAVRQAHVGQESLVSPEKNAFDERRIKDQEGSMLTVGDRLPDFDLEDDRGARVTAEDLRAGTVVLYFYPKDDTPGCTRQACAFRDGTADFAAAGVRIFGISADDVASHATFRDKFQLSFPLIADPEHTLCEAFGVWGEQAWRGHRFTGIARTTFILRDGTITRVFPDVDVLGHADRMLAAAQQAQQGE